MTEALFKIIIAENPVPPKYVSTYVLEALFMSGDADAYETTHTTYTFDELQTVLVFLMAFDAVNKADPFDYKLHRGEGADFEALPNSYVASGYLGEAKYKELPPFTEFEWPSDTTTDGCCRAFLERWALWWYDASGAKHACTVTPK